MIARGAFLTLAVAIAVTATVSAAPAQQPGKVYRVVSVGPVCEVATLDIAKGTPWEGVPSLDPHFRALFLALQDAGLRVGRNVAFEHHCYRTFAHLEIVVAELGTRNLDGAVTWGVRATQALKRALRVPIIFTGSSDPVREGLVESIVRPGCHVTGVHNQAEELADKRAQSASPAYS